MTPRQVGKKLLTLEQHMKRERQNALRRVVRKAQKAAVGKLRSRGIGRAIWGETRARKKASLKTMRMVVKTVRVKTDKAGSMRSGIEAKGLAAMVEEGGRTRAHNIKPKNRKALKFPDGGIRKLGVHHPGSLIPREPFLVAALDLAKAQLPAELEEGHRRAIAAAGLA